MPLHLPLPRHSIYISISWYLMSFFLRQQNKILCCWCHWMAVVSVCGMHTSQLPFTPLPRSSGVVVTKATEQINCIIRMNLSRTNEPNGKVNERRNWGMRSYSVSDSLLPLQIFSHCTSHEMFNYSIPILTWTILLHFHTFWTLIRLLNICSSQCTIVPSFPWSCTACVAYDALV